MVDESLAMYREHILDLYKHPHHFGKLDKRTHEKRAYNPLCGDDITLMMLVKDGVVVDVSFDGHGCAICMAATSLLTDMLGGMSLEKAKKLTSTEIVEMLHIPVSPVRLKCALLSLDALREILKQY